MVQQAGGLPRKPCPRRSGESCARISERRFEFNGGGFALTVRFGRGLRGARKRNGATALWLLLAHDPFWKAAAHPHQVRSGLSLASCALWSGNAHAIAPAHQHAILGPAQVGDAHGKPDADRGQRDRESAGGDIGEHAVTEIVGLFPRLLVAGEVERLGLEVRLYCFTVRLGGRTRRPSRGLGRIARPELQHPMFFLRRNGPLGLHLHPAPETPASV